MYKSLVAAIVSLLFVITSAHPAFSETIIYSAQRLDPLYGHHFVRKFKGLGDLSGDGISDYALILKNARSGYQAELAVVDGGIGHTLYPPLVLSDVVYDASRSPVSMVSLDDVNGDGSRDFAVGSSNHSDYQNRVFNIGAIRIFNGNDGAVIRTLYGSGADEYLGDELASPGDLTGDGRPDLLSCTRKNPSSYPSQVGNCKLIDASTGQVVQQLSTGDRGFGDGVRAIHDVNGDGRSEFVVSAFTNYSSIRDSLFLFDGATRSLLATKHFTGSNSLRAFYAVAGVAPGEKRIALDLTNKVELVRFTPSSIISEFQITTPARSIVKGIVSHDIDDDSQDEILVAYNIPHLGTGGVNSYNISHGSFEAEVEYTSEAARAQSYPTGIENIGDVNGDGSSDLFIMALERTQSSEIESFRVVSQKNVSEVSEACGQVPGDSFRIEGNIAPGSTITFVVELANAVGNLGLFADTHDRNYSPARFATGYLLPTWGCHTLAGGSSFAHIADIPFDPIKGEYRLDWTIPNNSSLSGGKAIFAVFAASSRGGLTKPRDLSVEIE